MNPRISFWGFPAFIALFLSFFQIPLYSQTKIFKGVVEDEQNLNIFV